MIFPPIYTRERIEEFRSRLSILKSSFLALEQNFWTVFDSFLSSSCPTPYIFPTCTFKKLETEINNLDTQLSILDPDDATDITELNDLSKKADGIQFELMRLQDVFAQRISGVGIMKVFEFQPILQIEYGTIAKAYNAVDALTFELVKNILGPDWIRKEKYAPICLFDKEYMINISSYVISVPYYDSFRSRFWPALAHEVAHIMVYTKSLPEGVFKDFMLDGVSRLMEILDFTPDDRYGRKIASLQISELASDIISVYICPPSFLTGAYCLDFPIETQINLEEKIKYDYHPPTDSRLIAMQRVLDKNGVLETDKNLQKSVRDVFQFFRLKNIVSTLPNSRECLENYNKFAKSYSEAFLQLLPQFGLKALDGNQWNLIMDASINQNGLSPIQLICLAWMKRLKTTKTDGALNIKNYFEKRKTEPKIFEDVIRLMYEYYKKEICNRMTKVDLYDLRIGIA